ncbi:hypothetical protein [Flavivirga eckloniae]|uniref:DUF3379 domain-containing protein n=1 Tax=Flavivirga eckloniae TaxID=1803846 RepID=A0A2K9PUU3_9FLAO|nr:hypothetical protein [Flavivirga eckloniae]AUP80842.1 hypothetical protein C1H87_19850 [Flavivirga eckloniae]
MVLNNIEDLLEKYENGETTLKEEQQLKHYFSQETVAPHLEMYKPMFAYFLVNQQEQFTKDIPLKTRRKFNYKWVSVAAVAVLMLGFYLNQTGPIDTCQEDVMGTFCEPEEAFNEVSKSLAMISSHFNKGTQAISYLDEMDAGTSTIGYLNEIENTTSIIFKN